MLEEDGEGPRVVGGALNNEIHYATTTATTAPNNTTTTTTNNNYNTNDNNYCNDNNNELIVMIIIIIAIDKAMLGGARQWRAGLPVRDAGVVHSPGYYIILSYIKIHIL